MIWRAIQADILFDNSQNIEQKLEQVITDSGFTYRKNGSKDALRSTDIEGNMNWAYLSSSSAPIHLLLCQSRQRRF